MMTCKACGTLYAQRLPASVGATDYDAYYTEANLSVSDFIHDRVAQIVAGFLGYRQKNRLLEIGFGAGALLRAAARAGWNAEGLEISKPAVDHLSKEGLNLFCGELFEAHYPDGYFDVVVATELLEHVEDPGELVREIARILRPGGLFWATTPNVSGLSGRFLGLNWTMVCADHLHLFSRKGVHKLLLSAGFKTVHIKSEGVDPFELWQGLMHPQKLREIDIDKAVQDKVHFNEEMTKSKPKRLAKDFVNGFLRASRLGDSLKISAER
jgi:2-polyprenyl-3-methyl-5-hydroxy-6-metoxy-1,4-benzoquinol methylase